MRPPQLLTLTAAFTLALSASAQPDTWTRVSDIGYDALSGNRFTRESAVTFSLGGTAYMGTGMLADIAFNDLWAYDPASNSWSQRADLPGAVRSDAVAFTLGGKGYVAAGESLNGVLLSDPSMSAWLLAIQYMRLVSGS